MRCCLLLAAILFACFKPVLHAMSDDALEIVYASPALPAPYDSAATISGIVSDAAGRPITGATISITSGSGASQTATSDAHGRYRVAGQPGSGFTISVTAKGFKNFEVKDVSLVGGETIPLDVSLERGRGGSTESPAPAKSARSAGTAPAPATSTKRAATASAPVKKKPGSLSGLVTDATGTAIPGASVTVTNSVGLGKTVIADAKGGYNVTGLPPGTYDLSATAPGFKPFAVPGVVLASGASIPLDATLEAQAGSAAATTSAPVQAANAEPAAASQPGAAGQAASAPAQENQAQQNAAAPAGNALPDVLFSTPSLPTAPPGATAQVVAEAKVVKEPHKGSVSGTVTDPSGAVVPGATVTIKNSTGFNQTGKSDSKGVYAINGIPPGSYDISVAAPGFKAFAAPGVSVPAGDVLPLDASLEAGGGQEEVNVNAGGAAEIETETSQVSGTITQKEVSTLQLNGRNFTQLIALTPGVSNQTGQDEAKVGVTGSVKYSVNGGRVEYNTFEVDGSDVLNAGLNGAESTLVVYPSLDAIQEVKVLTSNYGAMYGRTASGTVLVTTKSGGEKWHGDGYEFVRNEAFNARNYFDQTKSAPKYRRNDFGFTIGGPIKKDKTFIFWSEELRFENSPNDQHPNFNHAVPSLAERQGNFSDVCPPAGTSTFSRNQYPDCPAQIAYAGKGLANPFPNNDIFQPGSSGESSTAASLLSTNLIPLPNSSTGCNSTIGSCYDEVISEPTSWREELGRIDQNIGSKIRLSVHGIYDHWSTTVPVPQWPLNNNPNSFPTIQNKFIGPGVSLVAHLTDTITPTVLNELEASFTNSHITLKNVNGPGGANYQRPASLGMPGGECSTDNPAAPGFPDCPLGAIFNNGFGGKVPGIVIGGNNQEYGGSGFTVDPSYEPFVHTSPTFSYRDNFSWSIRKHTLQMGIQAIFAQRNEINGATGAASGDVQGLLTFSNVNGGLENTGNAFANFLSLVNQGTGIAESIQSYTQDSTQYKYYNRYTIGEPYIQDDWKATSRLTVNLGVRFSLFGLWNEKYHNAYNWTPSAYNPALAAQLAVDPSTGRLLSEPDGTPIPVNQANPDPRIINGIVQCGVNGVPNGCMSGHLFNPAPRVGVAWDPKGDGKTSIRAGYGIFFEHGTGEEANTASLEANAPLVLSMTQHTPVNFGCIGGSSYLTDPFCASNLPGGPGAYPLNITSIPTKAVWPYAQQWSLSVQRQLPGSMIATVAYVGSKGTHLTVARQLNQLKPIPSNENPFGPNEPIIPVVPGVAPGPGTFGAGDCGNFNGNTNTFVLLNNTQITPSDPAYYNLVAACEGANPNNGIASPTPDVNTVRPYPGLGQIFSLQNVADSSYHALQTTLRRTRGPLTAGVSYTYSHSIDDSSDRSDATFVNSYDLRSNKASSNYDQRHLLSISYIYSLPKLSTFVQNVTSGLSGQPTGDDQDTPPPSPPSRLLHILGDDWQVSGISVFQSGTPFSVINEASTSVSALDNAGVANGIGAGSYPDINPHPGPAPNERGNTESFGPLLGNPNLFVAPRGLTFGDAGRNVLNNPHRVNFDLSILKHFQITEGSVLEFRAEAFNVFNHTQFRIYNSDLGNTGSNSVSCYGGPNYSAGFQGQNANGAITGTDCVTGSSFLHPVDAHRPRTIQFAVKYNF